jgi:hypothetical protein
MDGMPSQVAMARQTDDQSLAKVEEIRSFARSI